MLWLIDHLGPIPFGAVMFLLMLGLLVLTDFILSCTEQHIDHNHRINEVFKDGKLDGE
jgi:hypothetical protein